MSLKLVQCFSRLRLGLPEFVQVRGRRRTLAPPPWLPPRNERIARILGEEDRDLMERMLREELVPEGGMASTSVTHHSQQPLLPDQSACEYVVGKSKRVGLIGKKIGMTPQWLKDGTRLLCTMIHCPDNHVLSVTDPDEWYRAGSPVGKKKAFGRFGPRWRVLVGAFDDESIFYSNEWRSLFARAGVPTKECLSGFVVTEDAVVNPGTKLDVRHFQVGQYVMVSGKTIDYGFQGVMRRWGMKGQKKPRTTKSHRRVGSIGAKGEAKVWRGRALPGHMGYEWRHAPGVQVVRINPLKQVIYVKGCIPGDQMEMVLIKDCEYEERFVQNPPFPTYVPDETDDLVDRDVPIHLVTSKDIYAPRLFQLNTPSIIYTEADETKSLARDKTRAKTAKVKK